MDRDRFSGLLPGGCVGVVAPAGTAPPERRDAGFETLKKLGYDPHWIPLEEAPCAHYLASSDAHRGAQLTRAIEDPSLDALWCLRGGYGSMRTLGTVDPAVLSRLRKPLIGFSDITILLLALSGMEGCAVHGPVVTQLPNLDAESLHHVQQMLAGQTAFIPLSSDGEVLSSGAAEGPLLGGNLSLLVSSIGTPWQPTLAGCILFLEDVNEPAYRVDRMLTQMRLAGVLDGVHGVALGHFSGFEDRDRDAMERLFEELASWIDGPVVTGLPCGHGSSNVAIPLGVRARLDTDAFELSLMEAVPPDAGNFP